ncbi:VOC family protein [Microbacterium pseudoresistens]|uniref:PhnB protein n=1 Tax=Microbacterium pseudoresistens TaxID=640634 RepID=A0A7Y9ESG3_9MICO|nr:VOC family protein [Microbacterium pseudoresistens]NYD53114.1 PhnB protein [Microbacterium pseudoresistens]
MTTDTQNTDTQNTTPTGATGTHTTDGRPHSATSLTPFLAVRDARGAIGFYRDVFGARVVDVTEFGGVVSHADLDFGMGRLQLGEPSGDFHLVAAPDGEDDCYSLGLYVPDTDAVVARAEAAGATVREAPSDFVSGDRYASIRDPFGVRWSIMTRVEDLSDEESAARVAEWAASFTASPTDAG